MVIELFIIRMHRFKGARGHVIVFRARGGHIIKIRTHEEVARGDVIDFRVHEEGFYNNVTHFCTNKRKTDPQTVTVNKKAY